MEKIFVPRALFSSKYKKIGGLAKLIYADLFTRCKAFQQSDKDKISIKIPMQEIASHNRRTVRTIKKHILRLEEVGLLKISNNAEMEAWLFFPDPNEECAENDTFV